MFLGKFRDSRREGWIMIKYLLRMLVVLSLISTIEAWAQSQGPMERIKETTDKIIAILSDPALKAPEKAEERRRLVREAVDERFDWEEFSRRALGRHWRNRTPEEKKAFVPLFGQLVERTYRDKVEDYSGEKVNYLDERTKDEYGLVRAEVLTNDNRKIAVDYRLRYKKNDWFVYDVTVEGVSLVNNYRVQFNDIIMKSGYDELLKRLKEKVTEE